MPPDDGSHLTVVSGDQQNFYVDREMFFEASTFVRNAIADTAGDVPLTLPPWVGSRSLRSALQHTRWHASRKPSTTLEEAATWDRNFIMTVAASSQEALLSLLRTASYLEMERLITLICRHLCVAMRKNYRRRRVAAAPVEEPASCARMVSLRAEAAPTRSGAPPP